MKKFLLTALFAAVFVSVDPSAHGYGCATARAQGGLFGLPAHAHSSAATGGGTLSPSGTLSSTKSCATGYTRVSPNLCMGTAAPVTVLTLTGISSGCVFSTALTGVTDAKAVLIRLVSEKFSTNAVNAKVISVFLYTSADTICNTPVSSFVSEGREFAAVSSGTRIWRHSFFNVVRTDGTGRFHGQHLTTNGHASDVTTAVPLGYLD